MKILVYFSFSYLLFACAQTPQEKAYSNCEILLLEKHPQAKIEESEINDLRKIKLEINTDKYGDKFDLDEVVYEVWIHYSIDNSETRPKRCFADKDGQLLWPN